MPSNGNCWLFSISFLRLSLSLSRPLDRSCTHAQNEQLLHIWSPFRLSYTVHSNTNFALENSLNALSRNSKLISLTNHKPTTNNNLVGFSVAARSFFICFCWNCTEQCQIEAIESMLIQMDRCFECLCRANNIIDSNSNTNKINWLQKVQDQHLHSEHHFSQHKQIIYHEFICANRLNRST